jgi:hypothetical protein
MSEHMEPDDSRGSQLEKKQNKVASPDSGKNTLETKGPAKKERTVLHKDGSFADLPDKEGKGSGALDGTVGRGM